MKEETERLMGQIIAGVYKSNGRTQRKTDVFSDILHVLDIWKAREMDWTVDL